MTKKDTTPENSAHEPYKVLDALSDAATALQYNLGTVITMAVISSVLSFLVLIFCVILIALLLNGSASNIDIERSLGPLIIIGLLGGTLLAFVSSFAMSAYSKLIQEGSKNRKIDVSRTIEFAKGKTKQVFVTSLYMLLVIAGPLFVSAIGSIIFARNELALPSAVFGIATIASVVWMVIATFRFGLAAHQVAVFEKIDGPKAALVRSTELMDRPSRWFFLKLVLLAGAFSVALEVILPNGVLSDVVANVISAVVGILFNGALTLLYFRRAKEAKSSSR